MPTRAGRTLRAQRVQMGVPSPKKPWRAEAQRFAHAMGKRKRLGRPPLDLFLLATIQDQDQVRMGPPPTGEAGTRARQCRYCFLLGPLLLRCDAMIQSDKWAPRAKRRQRVLQNIRYTCSFTWRASALQDLPCVGRYLLCDCGKVCEAEHVRSERGLYVAACEGSHAAER